MYETWMATEDHFGGYYAEDWRVTGRDSRLGMRGTHTAMQ